MRATKGFPRTPASASEPVPAVTCNWFEASFAACHTVSSTSEVLRTPVGLGQLTSVTNNDALRVEGSAAQTELLRVPSIIGDDAYLLATAGVRTRSHAVFEWWIILANALRLSNQPTRE